MTNSAKSNEAERVIRLFGGLTKTANAIGAPVTTVQSWGKTGRVPRWRRAQIAAAAHGLGRSDELPSAWRHGQQMGGGVNHGQKPSARRRAISVKSGAR